MRAPKSFNDPEIEGVKCYLLSPFKDDRGFNGEIYKKENYQDLPDFKLDSYSCSKQGVIRGFHGDLINDKLIHILMGEVKLILIDIRPKSSTYNSVSQYIGEIGKQIFVPAGVVNAHQCLTGNCLFYYKWSVGYVPPEKQLHVKWNDVKYSEKIKWTIPNPILSERDQ